MAVKDWRKIVGKNVRRLRHARELTQDKLAQKAKIDVTYVRGIEAGRYNPSLMIMARIAGALSCKIQDLLRAI